MELYEMVVLVAEKALEELTRSKTKNIRGTHLIEWALKNQGQFNFNIEPLKVSWSSYLTRAISDPKTKIAREPGKYSLILKDKMTEILPDSVKEVDDTEEKPVESENQPSERQKREEVLYQLLSEWFSSKLYNSEVTANLRKGTSWGNPDIVGIMLVDDPLGRQQIEMGTIEAKISLLNWRKEFFEAVSHKRFSNRSYFAFAVGANEPAIESIPNYDELRKYGEKYNVGVLAVFLAEKDYQQLTQANVTSLRLTLDDVVVSEIWPARYELVGTIEMYEFVKNVLGLDSPTKVNNFGKR